MNTTDYRLVRYRTTTMSLMFGICLPSLPISHHSLAYGSLLFHFISLVAIAGMTFTTWWISLSPVSVWLLVQDPHNRHFSYCSCAFNIKQSRCKADLLEECRARPLSLYHYTGTSRQPSC